LNPASAHAEAAPAGLGFDRLLAATALARGEADALADPTGARLSFRQLDTQVGRLATLLAMVRDGAGDGTERPITLGILAPMGPQAAITLLAALRIGMRPFLIPPDIAPMALAALLERHGAEFAIGIDRVGGHEPLYTLREAAARVFALRFVAGFGAAVPDGIVALDRVLAEVFAEGAPTIEPSRLAQAGPFSGQGRIGLLHAEDPYLPLVDIDEASLLASGLRIADEVGPAPGSQIVTTLVGGGLESLATGLATALVGGIVFLPLGLFDSATLEQALSHPGGSHLVIPAAVEEALHRAGLLDHPAIESLIVVGAEATPAGRPARALPVLDIRATPGHLLFIERR
jgi:hypothetical protein